MDIVARAKLRHLRTSPRKVRLVADLIRGKHVEEALNILQFTQKGSSEPLAKLVKSAVANADQRGGVDIDNLYVGQLTVDAGPTLKRFMPRAQGRATPILKRTSHVSIALELRD
ncbi:MAG TPA: 50S ribosomal protein L22 [Myxococcales bacterium LLY-WYZ-16_1]|jgi:large subunit ribosomal protein L22|nr:50S ribosomal protein L22 [Myxococcales bacterium LLY-WYZ-16_1]